MNATVVEATLKGTTRHDMPVWLQEAYSRGFKMRLFRTVETFKKALPVDCRKLIKSGKFTPNPPPPPPKPSWVFYDELATPEELQRAIEYYERAKARAAAH